MQELNVKKISKLFYDNGIPLKLKIFIFKMRLATSSLLEVFLYYLFYYISIILYLYLYCIYYVVFFLYCTDLLYWADNIDRSAQS